MSEWSNRDDRQRDAKVQYEHIMTTPAPPAMGAYIDAGVIGFVFGEMWRRGALSPRDRRWITLACVGAADAPIPMETHTYAALNSGDVTNEEIDEFLLFFGTQMGWPKGSAMNTHILGAMAKIAAERGEEMQLPRFVPWADPIDDDERRARGEAAYADVHGVAPVPARTVSGVGRISTFSMARCGPATSTSPAATDAWSASAAAPSSASTRRPPNTSRPRCAALSSATRNSKRSSSTSWCTWGGSWPADSTTCSSPPPHAPASSPPADGLGRQVTMNCSGSAERVHSQYSSSRHGDSVKILPCGFL